MKPKPFKLTHRNVLAVQTLTKGYMFKMLDKSYPD